MELIRDIQSSLPDFLMAPWAADVGLLLVAMILAYPAALWAARRLRRGDLTRFPREERVLRRLCATSLWPAFSMIALLGALQIWDRIDPLTVPRRSSVAPLLGFFLLYRVLDLLTREFLPEGERQNRLRRAAVPSLIGLAAMQQIGLLGPLLQFLQRPIFEPAGVSVSLFSILGALALILAFIGGARLLSGFLSRRFLPGMGVDQALSEAISTVVRYLVVFFGLMMGLTWLGFDITTLQIAFGALGVGIGFGLQTIVNNFMSGLILLFERSVKRGDILNAAGTDGRVTSIGLRASVLRTRQGDDIIVPNSLLVSERVTNFSFGDKLRRLDLDVGVSYSSDPPRIREMLIEVGGQHPDVLAEPKPTVLFRGFGESSLDFQLRVWIGDAWRTPDVGSDLRFAIWEKFKQHGVQIPFPQRDLHLRSGFSPTDRIGTPE